MQAISIQNQLSWRCTKKEDLLQCIDGSRLVDTATEVRTLYSGRPERIFATQSIPQGLSSFEFQLEVINGGTRNDISFGFADLSDSKSWASTRIGLGLCYFGVNGEIKHGREVIATVETFGTGDIVGCRLCRVYYDNQNYNICQFTKNNNNIGPLRLLIEEKDEYLSPFVGSNSPDAKLDTKFGAIPGIHLVLFMTVF